ncbi:ABC transporter ATP-binding protein [Staphylococcus lutrae]|uniref:Sulfonate ABC transporter ATP-binding protein n=1 Tax=Staphylococcus lutrae TaxID=155085 RepID=A0AAC9RR19_9STAP|nr:ABC transporter ATP-binding protein [Staphylococcus lutrae]ARJ50743.1 sulfonate ABC transporter ATP-binding protein [Staphylococcus lutrae]PNZ37866.1 ABC transporter ATP-binding protein [Staphylococcus lutrae]
MIEIQQLNHYFDKQHVIQNFSLSVPRGKIISFIGKSGCGKSTLLNIIGGFLTPSTGQVSINGARKTAPSAECLMLFQHHNLLPWKTVRDNIKLGLQRPLQEGEIEHHLVTVGLKDKGNHFPESLSGGMKQRVAICRALVHQPDVILLDEPLGALDAFTRYQLQDVLITLSTHTQATLILVTHDIDEALYLSDEVILLGDGCRIINQYPIHYPHPRHRNNAQLLTLRDNIMKDFAIHHTADSESIK